jgi:WD40 repeat protein
VHKTPGIDQADNRTSAPRLDFPNVHQGQIDLFKLFQGAGNGIDPENNTLLASADSEGLIALWVLLAEGPKLLHTLKGHSQTVRGIRLLPTNQKLLVSAAYEGTVRLWDIDSGAQISVCQLLDGHERVLSSPDSQESREIMKTSVSSMVATPDGRLIFGGGSGYVRVWNANTR